MKIKNKIYKHYNKVTFKQKIIFIILLLCIFAWTFTIDKVYYVTCWDGEEIMLEEFNNDWESLCKEAPILKTLPLIEVSTFPTTSNSVTS